MFTSESHKEMLEMLHMRGYSGKTPMIDYCQDLSDESGVDISRVRSIIVALGIEELFTGVVKAVEQFAETGRVEYNF